MQAQMGDTGNVGNVKIIFFYFFLLNGFKSWTQNWRIWNTFTSKDVVVLNLPVRTNDGVYWVLGFCLFGIFIVQTW